MPKRIQRKRIKGWKMPANAVYVGRPGIFGNPFVIETLHSHGICIVTKQNHVTRVLREHCKSKKDAASIAVEFYETHAKGFDLESIRGKDLACWCPLDQPCHADVLLRLANV